MRNALLAAALLCGACTSPPGPSPPQSGSSSGPLPVHWSFNVTEPVALLYVSASAFSQTADQALDVLVVVDGTVVGHCRLFSNARLTHRALVCPMIRLRVGVGTHSLQLRAGNSATASDDQDVYEFTLIEP